MTALWVLLAIALSGFALNWLTAAPAARGVPASTRLAEVRRMLQDSGPDDSAAQRRAVYGETSIGAGRSR